ncbi:MAG: hypothetical protein HYY37_00160 [Candidatus Aenigmarchaeota archaeon]|nr:hypothetical protein [Candidatus Aenigmarchaeota archaeon]
MAGVKMFIHVSDRGKSELGIGADYVGFDSKTDGKLVYKTNFVSEGLSVAGTLEYDPPIPKDANWIRELSSRTAPYLSVSIGELLGHISQYAAENGFGLGDPKAGMADFDVPDKYVDSLDVYIQEVTGRNAKIKKV